MQQRLNVSRPLIIGHRGCAAHAPENTLPSFQQGLQTGVDLVELDYRHSRDGVPVVIHDATLDRTTDARKSWGGKTIRVDARSVADLQSLDAGSWFDPEFSGTRIPLLAEALNSIQSAGGMTVIERKAGDARTCVELLQANKLINHVVVISFDWEYLRAFHELAPTQILGALGPPAVLANGKKPSGVKKTLNAARLDQLQKTGAQVVVWDRRVTRESVVRAHQRGLKVWIYTIDQPSLANRLLDLGVDGIITNNPALILKTTARRRMAQARFA